MYNLNVKIKNVMKKNVFVNQFLDVLIWDVIIKNVFSCTSVRVLFTRFATLKKKSKYINELWTYKFTIDLIIIPTKFIAEIQIAVSRHAKTSLAAW